MAAATCCSARCASADPVAVGLGMARPEATVGSGGSEVGDSGFRGPYPLSVLTLKPKEANIEHSWSKHV